MSYRISIDVGGTFTDLLIVDENTGETCTHKTPTTPHDLTVGVMNAIKLAADALNKTVAEMLGDTVSIVHGTTATTNALIEGKVAKVGFITTRGFTDVLPGREGGKQNPFNWKIDFPDPFIPRYLILPVTERINSEGEVEVPLNEEEVREAIRKFKRWNVEAVSVCLLWSIANPKHEERIGEIIEEEWPGIPYDLSHRVNPIIREYRRSISTTINSSLRKIISEYISKLGGALKDSGFTGSLFLMTSSGGVLDPQEVVNKPILTFGSGPSMLPVAALHLGMLERNTNDVIGVDMGGTSFDVAFVRHGEIILTREAKIKPTEEGGDKLGIAMVDVESIGSGGGSIAWIDPAGYLHVGPQSAGADPGPACYGLGGTEPTVTDANLVLGYLDPEYFLAGRMKIHPDKAEKAIKEKVADKLGIDVVEAASRIYTTVNYDMIVALRDLSIRRGIDPRLTLLVGGGGAFGIHAAEIAKEIGVKEILIPKKAGVLSSFGGLVSDIKQDFRAASYTRSDAFDFERVNRVLDELEKQAEEFLERAGVTMESRELRYSVEARYPYQIHELDVPLRFNRITEENLPQLIEDFHDTHFRFYAVKDPESPIECINWRISAVGKTKKTENKGDARRRRGQFTSPKGYAGSLLQREEKIRPNTSLRRRQTKLQQQSGRPGNNRRKDNHHSNPTRLRLQRHGNEIRKLHTKNYLKKTKPKKIEKVLRFPVLLFPFLKRGFGGFRIFKVTESSQSRGARSANSWFSSMV
ncbi:MAG: hydantoinase/oxoprolinase family protein [Candidatus Freyarchaeota archaeon]